MSLYPRAIKGVNNFCGCSIVFYAVMSVYVPKEVSGIFFFLLNSLHREMDKKDDLSFRCFLKLLLELMLSVNIRRDGCLLGIEIISGGLGKGDVFVGDCCTFELVLVTYTACGGNRERRWDFCWCFQVPLQSAVGSKGCCMHSIAGFLFLQAVFLVCFITRLFFFFLLFLISPPFISAFLAFTHWCTRIPSLLKTASEITTLRLALLGTQQGTEPMLGVKARWF